MPLLRTERKEAIYAVNGGSAKDTRQPPVQILSLLLWVILKLQS
ncbi:MAG: hypothetical protein WBE68_24770 [Candidatus Nitrosopolaris sp.]